MSLAEAKTCFIAMPITTTSDHQQRYSGDSQHWRHVLDHLLIPAVEAAGFQPESPISTGSEMIHARIIKQLTTAQLVLCDLSVLNANVLFELGVRTSLNLPVALVAEEGTRLPFDTAGINTHFYEPQLRAWTLSNEIRDLQAHIEASAMACGGANPLWSQFGLELKAQEPSSTESIAEAKLDVALQEMGQLRSEMVELVTIQERRRDRQHIRERDPADPELAEGTMWSRINEAAHDKARELMSRDQLDRQVADDCKSLAARGVNCKVERSRAGLAILVMSGSVPAAMIKTWQRLADAAGVSIEVVDRRRGAD